MEGTGLGGTALEGSEGLGVGIADLAGDRFGGEIGGAAALMANADRLLAAPPEILPADVLAAKVP